MKMMIDVLLVCTLLCVQPQLICWLHSFPATVSVSHFGRRATSWVHTRKLSWWVIIMAMWY